MKIGTVKANAPSVVFVAGALVLMLGQLTAGQDVFVYVLWITAMAISLRWQDPASDEWKSAVIFGGLAVVCGFVSGWL